MNDYLISQFIDNELALDEKILFVETVHESHEFTAETKMFLEQEMLLRTEMEPWTPSALPKTQRTFSWRTFFHYWWQPVAGFAAAMVLVTFFFQLKPNFMFQDVLSPVSINVENKTTRHRFVILQEESDLVEIIGSFTSWQKIPLKPTGSEGYWEVTLEIPYGEHKYSFVVDGELLLPDPTAATQEPDDFGSINSILNVEGQT